MHILDRFWSVVFDNLEHLGAIHRLYLMWVWYFTELALQLRPVVSGDEAPYLRDSLFQEPGLETFVMDQPHAAVTVTWCY